MKPRLLLLQPLKSFWDYGRVSLVWVCVGAGRTGYGTCPFDAYGDWQSQAEKVW